MIRDAGLRRVNLRTQVIEEFHPNAEVPESLVDPRVLGLYEDRQGKVWVATFSGLERYDLARNGFVHFQHDPSDRYSLGANRVYSVFQDRDGAIWVGTYRGGVSRADPYNLKFEHYYYSLANREGLPSNNVLAILEDSRGDLWVGTDTGGVSIYSRDTRRFTNMLWSSGWSIAAIAEDKNGRLWFGTQGAGLVSYDRSTKVVRQYWHQRNNASSIGDNTVRSLYVDKSGTLWIGFSDKGLDRYDDRTDSFFHFWPDTEYVNVGVWCIYEDRRGVLWLGTIPGGPVYAFDQRTGVFTRPIREINGSVRAIYEDPKGIFWFGSWSGGMYRFDPSSQTVTRFTEFDGLANDFVKGMLADEHENLWISTEKGLSKFSPETRTFKNFTTKDGLQSDFFWSRSFCKGRDGRMYFGGTNGFNVFHPDSIRDNPNVPPVVITRFTVLNETVTLSRGGGVYNGVTLSHAQNFFSFDFVGLNYTAPERNQYAHKMEGFDKDWVDAGTRRYVSYTHLDPGSYTFKVKASNNDGVWNEQGTSLSIVILPPYWQTWWFRLLAIVAL
ncbi:MAG: Histidine kinase, partial [Bacteroidetes bacterium]|nr:Histidine kinase [Bacteroidota bacterium]